MNDKGRAWVLILLASVVLGLAISQCIIEWKPSTQLGWTMFIINLVCAVISIVYIAKNARFLGTKPKDEDFD